MSLGRIRNFRCLVFVVLIVAGVFGMPASTVSGAGEAVPHKVMAFYYPWYGVADGPGGAGRTVHWGRIDEENKDLSQSTHYPALGAYDSHDPQVIEQHCKWAREAGIDTFIVSWWGHGDYTDRAMRPILDICGKNGMTACIYYETIPGAEDSQAAARDIVRVLQKYGGHSAYLRAGGKPVVFVYGRALQEMALLGWLEAIKTIEAQYDAGVCAIGDKFGYGAARVFGGVHTYNPAGMLRGKSAPAVRQWCTETYRSWVDLARGAGKISTITVIPGYDDTKIREPGLAVERYGTQLYRVQWERAIEAGPDWVVITSFNEWHEGSEIEPSHEDGRVYMELTGEYAGRFKAGRRVSRTPMVGGGVTEGEKAALAEKYKGFRIAALADVDSMAFWWLHELGVAVDVLTWEQVARGELVRGRYEMALYCGGEHYSRTVSREGDVDDALVRYLGGGGTLVAAPSLPWPFYYDQDETIVNNSARFGLTMRMGFENPPEGEELRFVQIDRRLKHVPAEFEFPAGGDLRWRAFVNGGQDVYVPLVQLRDKGGESLGDAVAYAELSGGGRVVYVWFTMLNGPYAEGLLYDVFDMLAARLGN